MPACSLCICCAFIVTMLFMIQCGLFSKNAENIPYGGTLQGLKKEFPDKTPYYVIYSLPGFFPGDIPVYQRGKVQRIYVYDDRNMDIVMETTARTGEIVNHFREECKEKKWRIERSTTDPAAQNSILEIPLQFNKFTVDILKLTAAHGRIFAAHKGSLVTVCRIIQIYNTNQTLIVQNIRMNR